MNRQALTSTGPIMRPDSVDLELYLERLAHHEQRLIIDIEQARRRQVFADLEDELRSRIGPVEAALLEAVGVIARTLDGGDAHLIARRARQLEAVRKARTLVEQRLHSERSGS